MKVWMISFGTILLAAALAGAGELPKGHPDISKIQPTSRPAGEALPPGHPNIPPSGAALPPGHPKVPNQGDGALPPGHPSVPSKRPTTGPAATVGTLTIRVKQGTQAGPSVAGRAVAVDLYCEGQVLKTLNAKLDESGSVALKDVPVVMPVLPLVRILQAGVQYQRIGEAMDGYNASQTIDLTVYESTDNALEWTVGERQAMITAADDGLHVMEMLRIVNASDKTWLGVATADGRRQSVWVALPAGIQQFQAEGPEEAFQKSADGKLTSLAPLLPGISRMMFAYVIPLKDSAGTVTFTAPKDVQQMTVYVQDGLRVSVDGLRAIPPNNIGGVQSQIFKGAQMKAGEVATLKIRVPEKKAEVPGK